MLYVKDKDALLNRFPYLREEFEKEPFGDPTTLPFELGIHPWIVLEDSGFQVAYDKIGVIEGVLIQDGKRRYILTDRAAAMIYTEEDVFITKEEAIAHRDRLIDTMGWKEFYESFRLDVHIRPKEWGEFLDKIRPIYKEVVRNWIN